MKANNEFYVVSYVMDSTDEIPLTSAQYNFHSKENAIAKIEEFLSEEGHSFYYDDNKGEVVHISEIEDEECDEIEYEEDAIGWHLSTDTFMD